MKKVIAILAIDKEFWIWKNWDIPWESDLKNFKEITTNTLDDSKINAVVMWRKTWDSIPEKFRPFKNRKNIIISSSIKVEDKNIKIFSKVEDAIYMLKNDDNIETIYIIWWAMIYDYVIKNKLIDELYLTFIPKKHNCDTFVSINFDEFSQYFSENINVWSNKYLFKKYKINN